MIYCTMFHMSVMSFGLLPKVNNIPTDFKFDGTKINQIYQKGSF